MVLLEKEIVVLLEDYDIILLFKWKYYIEINELYYLYVYYYELFEVMC